MKRGFYLKIAFENIRKNTQLYIPRILAEAGLLGCLYIMITILHDDRLADALGGSYLQMFMSFGSFVIGLLSFILILYVNSFLMKRRKSDYGLYNVLGMEKRHVIRVLFAESVITSLASAVTGILFGILFYKASSVLICRLMHSGIVPGFYYLDARTVIFPVVVFMFLDMLAFFSGSLSILFMKPVDLMAGKHVGETEPRVRWILLVMGIVSLGSGYYISLTTKAPLQALLLFFMAVLLVIVGTYCLFVAGTTFVLKCLKKNRKYYYQKNHMPAVAGLLFRMKQNAVGLASIAILATGVLVMISTTVSLYSGVQDTMNSNYPKQVYLSAFSEDGELVNHVSFDILSDIVYKAAENNGLEITEMEKTNMLTVSYLLRDDVLLTKPEAEEIGSWDMSELTSAIFITEETYERLKGQTLVTTDARDLGLEKDEIAFSRIMSTAEHFGDVPETLTIAGKTYKVKENILYFPISATYGNIVDLIGIVVADEEVMDEVYRAQRESYGEYASEYAGRLGLNFSEEVSSEAGESFSSDVKAMLNEQFPDGINFMIDSKWESLHNVLDMYGTFLFLGILLGSVCLFSTILIIYYKQISEGYEDRSRFQIMEKIGMEEREVKRTIGSQLILQFFLPLVTAAIHTIMAFPILLKLLKILMLTNTSLFVTCTIITLLVFAVVYVAVYMLTARTYYRIVH